MKRIITLLVLSLFFISCDGILKDVNKKETYVNIEYTNNRKQTIVEIAKFLKNDKENIRVSNGYSFNDKNDEISFISVSVKNPDPSIANDAIAEDLTKEVFKLLESEITNLNEFDKVHVDYYTIDEFKETTIRKETRVTLKVNQ